LKYKVIYKLHRDLLGYIDEKPGTIEKTYLQDDMTVPEDAKWAVKADYLRLLIDLSTPQEEQLTPD
jgi:hypothetical protein